MPRISDAQTHALLQPLPEPISMISFVKKSVLLRRLLVTKNQSLLRALTNQTMMDRGQAEGFRDLAEKSIFQNLPGSVAVTPADYQ